MRLYPLGELYGEMAFIAYHFHWSSRELMGLDHSERRTWCREISAINRKLDGGSGATPLDRFRGA